MDQDRRDGTRNTILRNMTEQEIQDHVLNCMELIPEEPTEQEMIIVKAACMYTLHYKLDQEFVHKMCQLMSESQENKYKKCLRKNKYKWNLQR